MKIVIENRSELPDTINALCVLLLIVCTFSWFDCFFN